MSPRSPGAPRPQRRSSRLPGLVAGNRAYLAALAVLVVLLGVMMLGPFQSLSAASDRVNQLQAERDRRAAEVAELEQRRAALEQPEQMELRARRELGYVEPGEIPFVVVTPEPEAESVTAAPAPAASRPWYRRAWDAVTGAFG